MANRYRIVEIDGPIIESLFHGWQMSEVTTDAPDDLQIVNGEWDINRGIMKLVVESETFDEVPVGHMIPPWSPTYTSRASELEAVLSLVREE